MSEQSNPISETIEEPDSVEMQQLEILRKQVKAMIEKKEQEVEKRQSELTDSEVPFVSNYRILKKLEAIEFKLNSILEKT